MLNPNLVVSTVRLTGLELLEPTSGVVVRVTAGFVYVPEMLPVTLTMTVHELLGEVCHH